MACFTLYVNVNMGNFWNLLSSSTWNALLLLLLLLNGIIKVQWLTRYQFDWGQLRGSFSRHTYMQTKLNTSTHLTQKHHYLKMLIKKEKQKGIRSGSNYNVIVWNFINSQYNNFQFTVQQISSFFLAFLENLNFSWVMSSFFSIGLRAGQSLFAKKPL